MHIEAVGERGREFRNGKLGSFTLAMSVYEGMGNWTHILTLAIVISL